MKFSRLLNTSFTLCPIKWVVCGLLRSLRVTCINKELVTTIKKPCILAFWHDQIPLALIFATLFPELSFRLIISNSQDGNLLANFAMATFPHASITRVVHNKKHKALAEMVNALEKGNELILITPDGPRGPAHHIKPGCVYAAQKTGVPIITMRWHASRFWQCSSWDKMKIPKPFARVTIQFSGPFYCPPDKDPAELESELARMLS